MPDAVSPTPSQLGRYRILRELGRGAMGIVYLAEDPKLERKVAIKTIKVISEMDPAEAEEAVARFRREAKVAGGLSHAGILTVYDFDETEDHLAYLVTEYVVGSTLESILKSGQRFAEVAVIDILIQAADALAFAHARGVVHRDIKPANLMRTDDGVVKIMDFGIARIADSDLTQGGVALGSPTFMSPEAIMGNPVDGRSDLFSLGVTAYFLLTGERPFTGDTVQAVTYRIVHTDPPAPLDINPQLKPEWTVILGRLLAKSPNERYPDGFALKRDLEALRDGQPLGALAAEGTQRIEAASQTQRLGATQKWTGTSAIPVETGRHRADQTSSLATLKPIGKAAMLAGAGAAVVVFITVMIVLRLTSDPYRAEKAVAGNQPRLAMQYIKNILAADEDDPAGLRLSVRAHAALGETGPALSSADALLKADPEARKDKQVAAALVALYGSESDGKRAQKTVNAEFGLAATEALLGMVSSAERHDRRLMAAQSLRAVGIELPIEKWSEVAVWMIEHAETQEEVSAAVEFVKVAFPNPPTSASERYHVALVLCASPWDDFYGQCTKAARAYMEGEGADAGKSDRIFTEMALWLLDPKRQAELMPLAKTHAGPNTLKAVVKEISADNLDRALAAIQVAKELDQPVGEDKVVEILKAAVEAKRPKIARSLLDFLQCDPPSEACARWKLNLLPDNATPSERWEALKATAAINPASMKSGDGLAQVVALAQSEGLPEEALKWLIDFPPVIAELQNRLKSDKRAIRWAAAGGLERLGIKVDRHALHIADLDLANDCSTRKAAVQWLEKNGDKTALPVLEKMDMAGFSENYCMFGAVDDAQAAIKKRGR